MKLEPLLSGLIHRCQAVCVPECCGLGAYDFSPIHIASFLLLWERAVNPFDVARVRIQLQTLRAEHGTLSGKTNGETIEAMNQSFTPVAIDALVDEILWNLEVAIQLIDQCEPIKFKPPSDAT